MKVIGIIDESITHSGNKLVRKILGLMGKKHLYISKKEQEILSELGIPLCNQIEHYGAKDIDILLVDVIRQSEQLNRFAAFDVLWISQMSKPYETVETADYTTLIWSSDGKWALHNQNNLPLITTGLGSKETVTASSIHEGELGFELVYCLQRSILSLKGEPIEPFEFTLHLLNKDDAAGILGAITLCLMLGIESDVLQKHLI